MPAENEIATEHVLVIEREFDAPHALVFKAWTDPGRFVRWWGPVRGTTTECEIDLRVGGEFVFRQRTPDGGEIRCRAIYREIVVPERLAWTWSFVDASGNVCPHPGEPGWPPETHVELTLAEAGGGTRMMLRHRLATTDRLAGMAEQGWAMCLDLLEGLLAAG